jgi:hypothetical protein
LTDAMRCHVQSEHISEKALAHCAGHLREELQLFPKLQTVVTLGRDSYWQFQREILGRPANEIKPFEKMLKAEGWGEEDVRLPHVNNEPIRAIYSHHPTMDYRSNPSLSSVIFQAST